MRIGDGGPDFGYPQGDPGAIRSGASALSAAAATLSTAAGQVSSYASSVRGSWPAGPAAEAFSSGAASVQSGLEGLAGHHRDAAGALSAYAAALSEARTTADQAAQSYGQAEQAYNTTVGRLAANPPTGAGASTALVKAENSASDQLNRAHQAASWRAGQACTDATQAALACAAKLSAIAEDVKDTALHKFLDLMGGPGTVFATLGVSMQVASAAKAWTLLENLGDGNFTALEKVNPKAWAKVMEVVDKYGPESMQALRAQLEYEADIADGAFGDMADAATSIGAVPSGAAGALDVLGKLGLVVGVASDVMTLSDGQSSGRDKVMAAANLGGIGMAAAGTELGGTALALVGVDSVAAAVPIAGEVVIAGTAVYFGYEWASGHWTDITHWADDAGGAVVHVAGGVLHGGERLLSDLNPF